MLLRIPSNNELPARITVEDSAAADPVGHQDTWIWMDAGFAVELFTHVLRFFTSIEASGSATCKYLWYVSHMHWFSLQFAVFGDQPMCTGQVEAVEASQAVNRSVHTILTVLYIYDD